ncbi:hypothetical protein RirG_159030 [Rhizophagus irregularis DAOM 197198w]|uniref:Uncharacterized protein n=1 Tax=Rhizophagus irregularis (strain DAOM 197198w) TaxID=1432141 RepID=A0A015J7F3_RHIIW|nr:hypothetical protein RirG_159030 [Rhizophagus irregularis DAOM 197198w]
MTKKHKKYEKHEKKKKSGKRYHSDIESSDNEKPKAKVRKTNKTVPKKQMDKQRDQYLILNQRKDKIPTLIDFVEDEEKNIVLNKEKRTKRRQSEPMKGQKGRKSGVIDLVNDDDDDPIQQDERDNDQTAFQEQVEELSQLIQKITKGKQKAANLKDMIIDWSGVETSDSPEKS